MPQKPNYKIEIPDDFDQTPWNAKGFYLGATLFVESRRYPLTVYDPVRLSQDIEALSATDTFFFESNLVVVPVVTRENIHAAGKWLVEYGRFRGLVESKNA